jgi:DNA-binding NarL/FixJ family response regulator
MTSIGASVIDDSLKETIIALANRLERTHSSGAVWVAKDVARKLKKLTNAPSSPSLFTQRESEILHHVANGFTNPEIATALGISIKTVQFHLQSIFRKTNTSSRTEAVNFAHKEKLLT